VRVNISEIPLPLIPSRQGRGNCDNRESNFVLKGGGCAKIKDEPWSGETIQKDRDRKGKGEEGVRTAYPD
jgi:hypothetical protein